MLVPCKDQFFVVLVEMVGPLKDTASGLDFLYFVAVLMFGIGGV